MCVGNLFSMQHAATLAGMAQLPKEGRTCTSLRNVQVERATHAQISIGDGANERFERPFYFGAVITFNINFFAYI